MDAKEYINDRAKAIKDFTKQQMDFVAQIDLCPYNDEISLISGIDLAYWSENDKEYAVCCVVTVTFKTKEVVEIKYLSDEIRLPYIPGFLSFRELPLILKTYEMLEETPDIVMFDGNGYLHYRHMGIATHASFYLGCPTIGVAKSYLKIDDVGYDMPGNNPGDYSDIIINNEVYGRALRTHSNVKPIFVSAGNKIDIDSSTKIVLALIEKDSCQPLPVRLADIETRKIRRELSKPNDA